MKTIFLRILALYCITTVLPDFSLAQHLPANIPLRVVIIRHGEKPDSGYNLSCQGYNRSLELPGVITSLFGVPDYTYVPNIRTGISTRSVRMYQTIVPFAVQYDLMINTRYGETDSVALAMDILKKTGTVLVVWDGRNIPPIARNLGLKNSDPKWEETDYDSIWIIDFVRNKDGGLQPELTRAKENINPSLKCK